MKGKSRNKTASRVLIIEGTSVLQNAANCLIKAGFKVASVPNRRGTLLTLGSFNYDIVVMDNIGGDDVGTYQQTQNILGAPLMLVG